MQNLSSNQYPDLGSNQDNPPECLHTLLELALGPRVMPVFADRF
jgi:hypothetical protein